MTSQYTPPFGADPFEDTGVFDDAYDLFHQALRHAQEDADLDPEQGGPRPVYYPSPPVEATKPEDCARKNCGKPSRGKWGRGDVPLCAGHFPDRPEDVDEDARRVDFFE